MFKIASSPRLVANIRVADTVLAARQLSVRSCVIVMCERNMHGLLASLNVRRLISCEVPNQLARVPSSVLIEHVQY